MPEPDRAARRGNAAVVTGLTSLMNPNFVNPHKSGARIEDEISGRGGAPRQLRDDNPITDFSKELDQIAQEVGLNFDDPEGGGAGEPAPFRPPAGSQLFTVPELPAGEAEPPAAGLQKKPPALEPETDLGPSLSPGPDSNSDSDPDSDSDSDSDASSERSAFRSFDPKQRSGVDGGGGDGQPPSSNRPGLSAAERQEVSRLLQETEADLGMNLSEESFRSSLQVPAPMVGPAPVTAPAPVAELTPRSRHFTAEQERRRHIDNVLGSMREDTHTSFGAQQEREQDLKASQIEMIEQLRLTLEEDGIDCSNVGKVGPGSTMEEIDAVLRILRLKNDRNRCATLAEEVILGVAEMIESVFDGTREVPVVRWKPDYTGYHNTVNVKLHRMRHETASVVSGIIEKQRLGPMARIALELLPSLALYPRQQQRDALWRARLTRRVRAARERPRLYGRGRRRG